MNYFQRLVIFSSLPLGGWIISHPHVIKYPIAKDYIAVKFDDVNEGVETELRQKVILQVSIRELHLNMLKKCYWVLHVIQQKITCLD